MLKIQVSGFGPILDGSVVLRPLTIFVGPNNAGKSYLATLMYAIHRAASLYYRIGLLLRLRRNLPEGMPWFFRRHPNMEPLVRSVETRYKSKSFRDAFKAWRTRPENGKVKLFGDLPADIRAVFEEALRGAIEQLASNLNEELQRCFASGIADLSLTSAVMKPLTISLEVPSPHCQINLSLSGKELYLTGATFQLANLEVGSPPTTRGRIRISEEWVNETMLALGEPLFQEFYGNFASYAYYLPAARSGILQSHKALAKAFVTQSSRVGIEKLDIPRLSGVVADFIGHLLTLDKSRKGGLYELATLLERDILGGEIEIEGGDIEYPEIYYKPEGGRFPLHRTSSMVSELAPIVLFLKYMTSPGDLLIIEEPESHLHPAVQRKLAQAIPRLIRANVSVVVTSHSDYFLEQLSNIVRLSGAPEKERVSWGYAATDYLDPNEVGAYHFDLDQALGGSVVKELPVTRSDGIAEEDLSLVAEQLYGETVQLDRRIRA